jgi:hypothetical protein
MAEFKYLKIELEKVGKELIGFMRSILNEQGHKASGNLDKSFRANVQVSDELVELNVRSLVDYWERLNDYGVRNTKGVYVTQRVIYDWMKTKSKAFSSMDDKTMKRKAYLISHRLLTSYPTLFGMNSGKSDFVAKADIMATEMGVYNGLDKSFNEAATEYLKFLDDEGSVIDIVVG